MTVTEFIRRKNELLKSYTGYELVPEDQIKEVEKRYLNTSDDVLACPYCVLFYENNCEGCPMYEAGNSCLNENSTYDAVVYSVNGNDALTNNDVPWFNELQALVEEFNDDLELEEEND